MRAWPTAVINLHRAAGVVVALAAAGGAALVGGHPIFAITGIAVGVGYYAVSTRRYRRRSMLLATETPATMRTTLSDNVPFYRALDDAGKQRFENDVRIFLAEQTISGLRGAPVDEEVKVLIAASAAMLTFGLPDWEWPRVRDIVVYPRAFDEDYDEDAEDARIAGMVHMQGPVLFSQRDLKLGFRRPRDGHNVGVHEMAHVMDMVDGAADGIPADLPWVSSAPWVDIVADRLCKVRRGRSVLRDYAGTNEAELFAVAVEAFYEQPDKLHDKDPELFDALVDYFNVDPRRPGRPPVRP